MRVKQYRQEIEMSQEHLARCTGLSVRQIRDIESGAVSPRFIRADTALRLAHVFGVSVEELLEVVHYTDDGKPIYLPEFEFFTPTDS